MDAEQMQNSILAAGAVMGCLWSAPGVTTVRPLVKDGQATNQLAVSFSFLKSKYTITVEIQDA